MARLDIKKLQEFSFRPGNLPRKIVHESDACLTGYWYHRFQQDSGVSVQKPWYLGLLKGQVIYSDQHPLSASRLISCAERYIPRLRQPKAKQMTETLQRRLSSEINGQQLEIVPTLLNSCYKLQLFQPQEMERALRLKVLEDLDTVLEYGGQARFIPRQDLSVHAPMSGLSLQALLSEARRRSLVWEKVRILIPALESQLAVNDEAMQQANITAQNKQKLQLLMSHGNTITAIAYALGRDTLEMAKGLAQLINKGLLFVEQDQKQGEPEIIVIDDSPIILKQFQQLVSSWGYRVRVHSDPSSALEMILATNPAAIFLDVNMPELSGFDLLKQIRRQPSLTAVPLIMLTAERTLSNNWRAQWSGCQFLSKPLSRDEIVEFQQELRTILSGVFS